MVKAFPKMQARKRGRRAVTKDVTLKDFSGGLYPIENETVLSFKYAPVLTNMSVEEEFSIGVRFGTKEHATVGADIVDMTYFEGAIIAILADGTIDKVDLAGTVTTIWNSTIAAALPGAPSGWSATTHVDFDDDGGELVVFNNVDKPVLIDNAHTVTYLQDLATTSNVNTPIAEHVVIVGNYTVVSNVSGGDDMTIVISNSNTTGTWPGDPAPNDATTLSLATYIGPNSPKIIGLGKLGKYLIVHFPKAFAVVVLGEYDASNNHIPRVMDVITETGILGHKSQITTEKDILFASANGVFSARQATFTEAFETTAKSENITPLLNKVLPTIPGLTTINSFAVRDPLKNKVFFFLEDEDSNTHIFEMTYTKDLKKIKWNTVTGWSFTTGCTSEHGRIFFGQADKIYLYGNNVFDGEEYYQDYLDTNGENGTAITIDWELPWIDFGKRIITKELRRLTADTIGEARFNLQIFVDKIYKDASGNYDPALEMEMVAGDEGGFGSTSASMGGGRNVSDERQYGFPVRFKLLKLRWTGDITEKLQISSISQMMNVGNYNR